MRVKPDTCWWFSISSLKRLNRCCTETNPEFYKPNSLADFLVLSNLLYVEQVVQPGLVVVFRQRLVQDGLGEKLVGRQRDLVAGQQAPLQVGHRLVGREFHDGFTGRVPALGGYQQLLPGCQQVLQV